MGGEDQALVVCSARNMGIGISVWSIETGQFLLHIPTCAAPPHGLLCLRDQFLVASQVNNKHGSVGGGSIFTWSLDKPHNPQRNYTMESIWPICSTKDGIYIAGGAPSGNVYLWEVVEGRLLKTWRAHHKSLKCLAFSADGSLLISGSEDGLICIWSLIRSLLDMDDFVSLPSMLHCLLGHKSSITGLLPVASSMLISSSLDGAYKAWDLISGRLVRTRAYPASITAMTIHPAEQFICSGCTDGSIFVNLLDIGLLQDHHLVAEGQSVSLTGHNGSITALAFCKLGLISASDDHTVCIWDIMKRSIIRRFNHHKGPVSNIAVISQSSLYPKSNRQRILNHPFVVSSLEKYPKATDAEKRRIKVLPSSSIHKQIGSFDLHVAGFPNLLEFDAKETFATLQMKVETYMDNRVWATNMTKHIMDINKHLQSHLIDMMQCRVAWSPSKIDSCTSRKMIKTKDHSRKACKLIAKD